MGATTALLYCAAFESSIIKGLVLDSPFVDLGKVAINMIRSKIALPDLLCRGVYEYFKSTSSPKIG